MTVHAFDGETFGKPSYEPKPRTSQFRFRISELERKRLDEAAVFLETTPSEVAREGMLVLVESVLGVESVSRKELEEL